MSMKRTVRLLRSYTSPTQLGSVGREFAARFTDVIGAIDMIGQWDYLSLDVGSLEFEQLRKVLASYVGQGWQVAPQQPATMERGGLVVMLRRQHGNAVA